jgi:enoyl-CoA hydratase/carnithine racemase
MPYSSILFQVEESGIALLTVNRPEKLYMPTMLC